MNLNELVNALHLENLTPELNIDSGQAITRAYASDLLSDVLAHGPKGGLLVTVQVHLNVVAVAVHAELAAVIFALGRKPDELVRSKAIEEGIALFSSEETAFNLAGRLYELGLRGLPV